MLKSNIIRRRLDVLITSSTLFAFDALNECDGDEGLVPSPPASTFLAISDSLFRNFDDGLEATFVGIIIKYLNFRSLESCPMALIMIPTFCSN